MCGAIRMPGPVRLGVTERALWLMYLRAAVTRQIACCLGPRASTNTNLTVRCGLSGRARWTGLNRFRVRALIGTCGARRTTACDQSRWRRSRSWNVDTDRLVLEDRACDLWGVERSGDVAFEDLSSHIHPADRDRVRAAFAATRAILGDYEIDFRILVGDEVRWISARGQGDDADIADRVMFGIFLDVTGRKQAEEANELLAGEMSHRVKNVLAVASGLTAITSRSTASTADMARELTQRLAALGRAHDLVRPPPDRRVKPRSLVIFSPSFWPPTTI